MKVDFRVSKEEAVTAIEVLTQARDKIQAITSTGDTVGIAHSLLRLLTEDIANSTRGSNVYIGEELSDCCVKTATCLLDIHKALSEDLVVDREALRAVYTESIKQAQELLTKEAEFHLRGLDERDPDRPRLNELIGESFAEIN